MCFYRSLATFLRVQVTEFKKPKKVTKHYFTVNIPASSVVYLTGELVYWTHTGYSFPRLTSNHIVCRKGHSW